MKRRRLVIRTIILFLLAVALVYTLYNAIFSDKEKVAVGDKAPDFVVTDLNGESHQLSDYKGQGVFLNFWGTWCKPCQREFPFIDKMYQYYKDQGVQVIAINVGEPEFNVKNFIKKYELTFPVAIDKGNQLQNAYGIDPLPTTLLIDKDGKVVKIITGEMSEKVIQQYMEQIKP
ncbi:thiol-disulfide oxidoreductase ResA [Ferdinandcohnia quinoae]|uniref:Thiol-disulfide oxidoreductase ResA n=1 Tax=Fredinandcohnia quinoae TaxID=2918902 RepID=A0AAW5DVY4_9BACI|nr:thiol-disulfide oxidoreductase ResA [Fredinandcohnia sp. SECRCQ15]MCH1624796.1 thiol-disulfide oxidoreductase ResA [Fredinandcohnia sp. SECRCQ15]